MPLLAATKAAAALSMLMLVRSTAPGAPMEGAALVIGEGAYRQSPALVTAVDDARLVAGALTAAGLTVDAVYDKDRAGLEAELAKFAAGLKPGQPVFVYFAGLSAKGPAVRLGEGLDNYLLPIDAAPLSAAELPTTAISLTHVLETLAAARAQAQVIVLDASRPNAFEQYWKVSPGLAEPTTSAMRNAYVAFAAPPGRLAPERVGPNSLFARELDKGLRKPGVSANRVFTDVSQAVEKASGGAQVPWFSGSGGSARWVPNIMVEVADDTDSFDPLAGGAGMAKTASGYPPFVDDFIAANSTTPGGMSQIGQAFLGGTGGFPKDDVQAWRWLQQAAATGEAKAEYLIGLFWETGRAPATGVDRARAVPYFRRAAEQSEMHAQYYLGIYYYHGYGGLPLDKDQGAQWIAKSAAAGYDDAKEIFFGHRAP